jgi:hypothetical protein
LGAPGSLAYSLRRVKNSHNNGHHGSIAAMDVSIDLPHSQQVCGELLERDALVDCRPKCGVRFSPPFYNTNEELAKA